MTARRLPAVLLLAPALIFVVGVMAYPLGLALYLSLTSAQVGEDQAHLIGLANFAYLLRQPTFGQAVANTAVYSGVSTAIKAGLGLAIAVSLRDPFPGRRIVYALIFLPFVFPIVVSTVAWYYLFSNVHGGINYLTGVNIRWLGEGWLPMASLITVNVWHGAALFGVLLLAALRSVPNVLLEQSLIDGAGPLRRARHIIAPHLYPALLIACLLSLLGTFGDFSIVHLLTGGGPANRTTIVSTMAFQIALRDGDLGTASAVSLALLPAYLLAVVFVIRQVRR